MTDEGPVSTLHPIADELYGLGLAEFTAARDDRARRLVKDGDRQLASEVKRLKKPSVAAWAVNMLVRHQGEQIEQALVLGQSLRQAQEDLDGDELRALTRQRRQLTAAITSQARRLAAELGQRLSGSVADQVEGTLHAAMIDEGAASAVRTGQLVASLSATGVGAVDVASAVADPAALGLTATTVEVRRPELHVVPDDDRAIRDAEAALSQAGHDVEGARAALESAERSVAELGARSLQLAEEIEELRRRIGELEHDLDRVDDETEEAEGVRADAAQLLAEAEDERAEAQADLERLRA